MMNRNIKLEYVAPVVDFEAVENDIITTSAGEDQDFSYEGPIVKPSK